MLLNFVLLSGCFKYRVTHKDSYGHQVGDVVLCRISDTIAANIRSLDCGR